MIRDRGQQHRVDESLEFSDKEKSEKGREKTGRSNRFSVEIPLPENQGVRPTQMGIEEDDPINEVTSMYKLTKNKKSLTI